MKICRVKVSVDKIENALIIGDEVYKLEGGYAHPKPGKSLGKFSELPLSWPVVPKKIIGIGLNYRKHAEEFKMKIPEEPIIFLKPSTALIGPGEPIILPPQSQRVDYEAELAIVISRRAKNLEAKSAKDYILGYTCFNDVTARDLQAKDGQWTRAKGFDSFAPVGPWIETELEPDNLKIEARLNGKVVQSSNTSDLIFNCYELVSFISKVMTLEPGDIIATGTPSGVGQLKDGDEIVIEIQGIGELKNPVRSAFE